MANLRSLFIRLATWTLALAIWASIHGAAWAAEEEAAGGDKGTSWIKPYFIVVFCIALGMLVVCRSARRRERAKPQEYESSELAGKSQHRDD